MSSLAKKNFKVYNTLTGNVVSGSKARQKLNGKGKPQINLINNPDKFLPIDDDVLNIISGDVYAKKNVSSAIANGLVKPDYLVNSTGKFPYLYNPSTYRLVKDNNNNRNVVQKSSFINYVKLTDDWLTFPSDSMTDFFTNLWDELSTRKGSRIFRLNLKHESQGNLRSTYLSSYGVLLKDTEVSEVEDSINNYDSVWMMMKKIKNRWYDSGTFKWAGELSLGDQFTLLATLPTNNIIAKKLNQIYSDAKEGHCVLIPIKTHYDMLLSHTKNSNTKAKYRTKLNILDKMMETIYKYGVPHDDLQKVSNELGLTLIITDVLQNEINRFVPEGCASNKKFIYSNIRTDHVELLTCSHVKVELHETGMIELKKKLDETNQHYCYSGKDSLPNAIYTLEATYKLNSELSYLYTELAKYTGMDKSFGIDMIQEPLLDGYISGCEHDLNNYVFTDKVLTRYVLNPDDDPKDKTKFKVQSMLGNEILQERDMTRAYAQFNKCEYYHGLPANITNIRNIDKDIGDIQEFLKINVGFYTFEVIKCEHKHLRDLYKIKSGETYDMYSAFILFFISEGLEVKLIRGAWGTTFNFSYYEFDEYTKNEFHGDLPSMIDDRHDKVRYYAHHIGCMIRRQKENVKKFKGTQELSAHLQATYDDAKYDANHLMYDAKVSFTSDDSYQQDIIDAKKIGIISISTPKRSHVYFPHINIAIKCHCAIQTMKETFKFDPEQLLFLKTDGYIFVGKDMTTNPIFRDKGERISFVNGDKWFCQRPELDRYGDLFQTGLRDDGLHMSGQIHFLWGQGGSGKTHSPIMDKGFRGWESNHGITYVTLMNRILVEKKIEYNHIRTSTLVRMLGNKKCQPYNELYGYPPIILIDEVTMNDKGTFSKIIEKYGKYSKIIFAGDINEDGVYFQCPPFNECDERINRDELGALKMKFIHFSNDYRAKNCKKLQALKMEIRDHMVEIYNMSKFDQINSLLGCMYSLIDKYQLYTINQNDLHIMYKKGDSILASTNNQHLSYTQQTKDITKNYIVTSHTFNDVIKKFKGEEAYLKGEIYDHEVPRSELRNCFTIHSYQGMTIKNPHRLFTDLRHVHEPTLFYTAVSRAESIKQLVFILEGEIPSSKKIKIVLKKEKVEILKDEFQYQPNEEESQYVDDEEEIVKLIQCEL